MFENCEQYFRNEGPHSWIKRFVRPVSTDIYEDYLKFPNRGHYIPAERIELVADDANGFRNRVRVNRRWIGHTHGVIDTGDYLSSRCYPRTKTIGTGVFAVAATESGEVPGSPVIVLSEPFASLYVVG